MTCSSINIPSALDITQSDTSHLALSNTNKHIQALISLDLWNYLVTISMVCFIKQENAINFVIWTAQWQNIFWNIFLFFNLLHASIPLKFKTQSSYYSWSKEQMFWCLTSIDMRWLILWYFAHSCKLREIQVCPPEALSEIFVFRSNLSILN